LLCILIVLKIITTQFIIRCDTKRIFFSILNYYQGQKKAKMRAKCYLQQKKLSRSQLYQNYLLYIYITLLSNEKDEFFFNYNKVIKVNRELKCKMLSEVKNYLVTSCIKIIKIISYILLKNFDTFLKNNQPIFINNN